ncbi:lasso peptide biosynthesis B2 protein [Bacillus sp. FSL W7-1360]
MISYIRVIYETLVVSYILRKYSFGYVADLYSSKYGNMSSINTLEKHKHNCDTMLKVVDKVCFWFFGNAQCLHRSLIGFKLARKKGIKVQMVIGVKKFPFSSHAWLEYNNSVINDGQSVRENYREVLRIGG